VGRSSSLQMSDHKVNISCNFPHVLVTFTSQCIGTRPHKGGVGARYNTNKTRPNTNEITKGDGGGQVLLTFRRDTRSWWSSSTSSKSRSYNLHKTMHKNKTTQRGGATCNARKIRTTNYKLAPQKVATHDNANTKPNKPRGGQ
jgi:hypothetical protein